MAYSGPYPLPVAAGGTGFTVAPSFSAYVNFGSANSVTGDGTIYNLVADIEEWDTTSSYNTGTGVFTAPVAGHYFFTATIVLGGLGAVNTSGSFYFLYNTTIEYFNTSNNPFAISVAGASCGFTLSTMLNLALNDTVQVAVQVSGDVSNNVNVTGGDSGFGQFNSKFGGYLIQ